MESSMQKARAAAAKRLGILENLIEESLMHYENVLNYMQNTQNSDQTTGLLMCQKTDNCSDTGHPVYGKANPFKAPLQPVGLPAETKLVNEGTMC